MKKIITFLLLVCILSSNTLSIGVYADTVGGSWSEHITWTLDLEIGLLEISGTGEMGGMEPFPWFTYWNDIKSVVIHEGVTSISNRAFKFCNQLKQVTIADTVTHIGESAFFECPILTDISLPDNLVTIGESAFAYCFALENVSLPDKLETIGKRAFFECINLHDITIPKSVIEIGQEAFSDCRMLTSIDVDPLNENYSSVDGVLFNEDMTVLLAYPNLYGEEYDIPSSVELIGDYAFAYCDFLNEITILPSVTSIGDFAFINCRGLKNVEIPFGVSSIGRYAFAYCQFLENIMLPESLRNIGGSAFVSTSVSSIIIPNGVISINGGGVFSYCYMLRNVSLPKSLLYIEDGCFSECPNLERITVDSQNEFYYDIDGVLFSQNDYETTLVTYPNKYSSQYSVPDGVTYIANSAFDGCSNLRDISLPDNLRVIDSGAFLGSGLENIRIPGSVEYIGYKTFADCRRLKSAVLEEGIKYLPDAMFNGCKNLTSVLIPKSVTSIYSYNAFEYCNELTIFGYTDTFAESYAFDNNIPFVPLGDGSIAVVSFINSVAKIYSKSSSDVSLILATYSAKGKLQQLKHCNNIELRAGLNNILITGIDLNLSQKLMIWGDFKNMMPLCAPYTDTTVSDIFPDVSVQYPYCNAINAIANIGSMMGYMDGTFKPDELLGVFTKGLYE